MPGLPGRLRPPSSKTKPSIPTVAIPSHGSPSSNQPSSRIHQPGNHAAARAQSKAASDRATAALIRRVLCPNTSGHGGLDRGSPRPLEELLPPLTSTNEIDLQLYALMAIVMREFVYSWYSKITPDTVFTEEVIQLIAHCTRALEQRLRRVDVETLLLDEIPSLIEAHIIAYRTARGSSTSAVGSERRLRLVYHMLNPHPALSPVPGISEEDAPRQREAERAYRQLLAHGAMAVLLPTEDLQNVCLRTLVGDILADLLLGGVVGGKVAEGWFIWDAISNILASLNDSTQDGAVKHDRSGNRGKGDRDPDQERSAKFNDNSSQRSQSVLLSTLFSLMHSLYLVFVAFSFVALGLLRVSSAATAFSSSTTDARNSENANEANPSRAKGNIVRLPVLEYRVFSLLSQLLSIPDRMPWLGGFLALGQHLLMTGPSRAGTANGLIDRFLHDCIHRHFLTATFLPSLLLAIRTTIFPTNGKPSLTRTSGISAATQQSHQQQQQPSTPSSDAEIGTLPISGSNAGYQSHVQPRDNAQELHVSLNPTPPHPGMLDASSSGSQQPSPAETESIKRACAANILALIPRRIALVIFASDSISGSKPSTTTGNKPDLFVQSNTSLSSVDCGMGAPLPGAGPEPGLGCDLNPSRGDGGHIGPDAQAHNSHHRNSKDKRATDTGLQHSKDSSGKAANLDDQEEDVALMLAIQHDILDPFSDSYCNKHLIYSIVEVILVKLIPEMGEHSVAELMIERGVPWSTVPTNGQ